MIDSSTALELIVEASLGHYHGQLLGPCSGSWNATIENNILRIWGECHDDFGHAAERFEYQWGLVDLGGIPHQRKGEQETTMVVLNLPPQRH